MPGPEAEHTDLLWVFMMPGAISPFTHTSCNVLNHEGHSLRSLRTGSRDRVSTLLPRIQVVQVVNQWPKTGYLGRGVSSFSSFPIFSSS
jgi:galactokinase